MSALEMNRKMTDFYFGMKLGDVMIDMIWKV